MESISRAGFPEGNILAEQRLNTLLRAIADERDKSAFAELFRYFAPRLKAYAMRGGLDATRAEELAQETMLAVWQKAASFDPARAAAPTWIFTIGRNKRIDMARREKHPTPETLDDATVTVADPAPLATEKIERAQSRSRILQGVEQLPDLQAQAIRMAFMEDKPHSRIAEELSLPLGTVKSRIRLGLESLRGLMAGAET